MSLSTTLPRKRPWAHLALVVSLVGKGGLGLTQLLAGLAIFAVPGGLTNVSTFLARTELTEDPNDPFALWITHQIAQLPPDADHFYTLYFVIHGLLNLGAVLALLAGLRWAYPASIAALVGFIAYQMYKYYHGEGAIMIVLTVIDILVIWLIWIEYKALRAEDQTKG
ncbi:DUF2127 domain-containing protein [Flavimaricola marinus]|uniref:DUF2127 domain-containing protein n=1 Tax=Flavimaricola marinus TaxID=1819565 RepID=A0A238LEF4_9RHOB|nr:DUF2127 domain-containing protein [Flavimaricola marinus]SMY07972.1 hypothetical protein LOM8899_02117 [Flavimaricola marinus]